jgi:hypothetical protein
LALPIGGEHRWTDVGADDWVAFAQRHRLDVDLVLEVAVPIMDEARQRLPDALRAAGVPARLIDEGLAQARG